jgi:peroxiredoxin
MSALAAGAAAPAIPGVAFAEGPTVVFFYKVTCPVCQMAAPKMQTFEVAYPGRIVGIGQDPEQKLSLFGLQHGLAIRAISDPPPYPASNAYRIRTVPTAFLISPDGTILSSVESWDRKGLNAVSGRLAELTGSAYTPISEPGDGLPPFRPG